MEKYNKNTTIGEVLASNPKSKEVFMGFGMHCFGCPMSQMETLEEAGMVHGIDVNLIIEKLNELSAPKLQKAKPIPRKKTIKSEKTIKLK